MTNGSFIAPTDLRDYAKARGWTLLPEAFHDRLYVLQNPAFAKRQLVFPMDSSAPDYLEAVALVTEKLAEIEKKPLGVVWEALQEVRDDTLRFRITTDRASEKSLPLAFATSVLGGAEQILLAAACTVLKPLVHHPRLSRVEAQQLLNASRFRHTEQRSFVVKVSCPINALDVQAPLLPAEAEVPFVRRATLTLNRALRQLVDAIEKDTLGPLVENVKKEPNPLLSSNLCEALTRFQDETLKNSLEVSVAWALSNPVPEPEAKHAVVRVQQDYFARIEEVRRELRSTAKHAEDTFIGTVERLDGEMADDGRRAGEVIVALLLQEGEIVRARLNLTADQYQEADRAHMTDRAYVSVTGKLHPGRQPRPLTDIREFNLLLPK